MHCIYNRGGRVSLGSKQPEEDSSAPNQSRRGRAGAVSRNDPDIRARRGWRVPVRVLRGTEPLAVVLTERDKKIRVVTAYDLDAGQKRDYLERRAGEE